MDLSTTSLQLLDTTFIWGRYLIEKIRYLFLSDHQKNQQQPPSPDKIYLRLCSQVNTDLCLILVDVNAYVTTSDKVNN